MPRVHVGGLPVWMPVQRLLGPGAWQVTDGPPRQAEADLSKEQAADLMARLRGLGFGGAKLHIQVRPSLKRTHVRAGRTREARARRHTTPGFTRAGVRLDEEGRFSLTPESLALAMGRRLAGQRVLDLTCGAGGNAIGFARAGCRVVAVDLDARRLDMARHNARIYQVEDHIHWVHGDALIEADKHACDTIFVDPPWGEWDKACTRLADLPLLQALLPHLPAGPGLWLKLPPSFDPASLGAGWQARPMFGRASGDRHRVKFLLMERDP